MFVEDLTVAVRVTSKDPYALLQDLYALLELEIDRLRTRSRDDEDFSAEDASKQLQRVMTSLRGAIKDTEALEAARKDEFSAKSDMDLVTHVVQHPETRAQVIEALRQLGWTCAEPVAEPVARRPKRVEMGATKKNDPKRAKSGPARALLESFERE